MSKMYNLATGQTFVVSESKLVYRFNRVCKGIDRVKSEYKNLQIYFLTLTLSDENLEVCNKNLHRFFSFMRNRLKRADAIFKYVWVLEIQKKRYSKYDKLARHWHIAILTLKGALPNAYYDKFHKPHYKLKSDGSIIKQSLLFKRWGYGQVLCKEAYSNVYGYLSKYLDKEALKSVASERKNGILSQRNFGSSNFQYYAFPEWAYNEIKSNSKIVYDMVCLRKGAYLVIIGLDINGNRIFNKIKRSPYRKIEEYY